MNKNIKKVCIIISAALIAAVNASGVFAATPVPAKSGGNSSSTATQSTGSTSSSGTTDKATSKPASTSSATSKPKATEKATSKPKTSSSSSNATTKPTASVDPSEEPSASPTIVPEDTTTVTDPLVFSEEADKSVVSTDQEMTAPDRRYTTKGGSFGWFILSIIINAIISFIIGNRFYRMSRRDNHILAEIRALKKDIDAKMQYNIGGFSEYETVINNSNKNYASDEEGLKTSDEEKAEELATEIYRKWESQVMAAKEREATRQPAAERRTPGTARSKSRVSQKRNNTGLTGKVKDFISDVFPFDKD